MHVHFEELAAPQRAGGIEAATHELTVHLSSTGLNVTRSSQSEPVALPGLVHQHGIWSPRLARRFVSWRNRGVPSVVTPHGMLEPWALAHKRLKKFAAWHLYQKRILNQAVLLHGTSTRETVRFKTLGLRPPTAMVPWGVSIPPAPTSHPAGTTARIALFVGRIYPVKGLPMLIEAWGRVRPPDWKLRIVGPDEAGHRAEVEAGVAQTGLSGVVEFTGELIGPAKDAAFAGANLFILPSHTENFGMAIAEAMGHGLPVIATKGSPWQELVSHRCGWWTDIGVEPLATALREALQLTDEQRHEMGLRGRHLIEQKYTWPAAAKQMLSVYQWLLGQGSKPNCIVS